MQEGAPGNERRCRPVRLCPRAFIPRCFCLLFFYRKACCDGAKRSVQKKKSERLLRRWLFVIFEESRRGFCFVFFVFFMSYIYILYNTLR